MSERVETTRTPAETLALGVELAAELGGRGVIWLRGPLGAGKTLLAKGIFGREGIPRERVTSPSFTLVNRYREEPPLYHIDLYRLQDAAAELGDLGLEELFDSGGLAVVEWAERLASWFPPPDLDVEIEILSDEERRITIRRPS